jgi:hypothetical protein
MSGGCDSTDGLSQEDSDEVTIGVLLKLAFNSVVIDWAKSP